MKSKQLKSMMNKVMTEFSSQLGIDGKAKKKMGRNIAMVAAGVIGFSLVRRFMKGSK